MSAERNLNLRSRRNHHGARSVACVTGCSVFSRASRPVSLSVAASGSSAVAERGQVASFRAGLRSSLHGKVAVREPSRFAVRRRVAGQSVSARSHHRLHFLGCPVPNKALVPTAQTQARLGFRAASGAAAAQRNRWALREVG